MNEPTPICTDRNGGALDWIDQADEHQRVCMQFMGDPYPKTPKAQEAWLIRQLREEDYQGFFFEPLAHKGLALDAQLMAEKPCNRPGWNVTLISVPLAQLFLLPNENPAQELAQMKAFLTWVENQVQGQRENGRNGRIQWFRSPGKRGLEMVWFEDKAKQAEANQALQAWREQPWFEAWHRANLKGLSKIRRGPHCWWGSPALRKTPPTTA